MNTNQRSKRTQAPDNCPREIAHGVLEIIPGNLIPCAVLDNEMRVLSTRGVSRAFGYKKTGTNLNRTGAPQPPPFLASLAVKPYLSDDLIVRLNSPRVYRPKKGGRTAYGYDHSVFPDICKAIVAADKAGKLKLLRQRPIAEFANAMLDALVGVAMVALIDEATGYQAERELDELQRLVKAYVVPVMLPWLKRFPSDFKKETYRLMRWKHNDTSTRTPRFMGKVINKWIYGRLPEPVLPELQRVNPAINGQRRAKHHQHLTPNTGIPHMDRQIVAVMALMRASRDRRQFEELLVRSFPVSGDQMPLGTATDVE
jgi:P63C domain-containing protein